MKTVNEIRSEAEFLHGDAITEQLKHALFDLCEYTEVSKGDPENITEMDKLLEAIKIRVSQSS